MGLTHFCGYPENQGFSPPSRPPACVGADCCDTRKGNVWYKRLSTCKQANQHNDTCTPFEIQDHIKDQGIAYTYYCGHNDKRMKSQLKAQQEPKAVVANAVEKPVQEPKAAVQNTVGFGLPCSEWKTHGKKVCCIDPAVRFSLYSGCIKTHFGCFEFVDHMGLTHFCGYPENQGFSPPSRPPACVGADCCDTRKGNVWYKRLSTCKQANQHNDTCTPFEIQDHIKDQGIAYTYYCGHNDKRMKTQENIIV